MPYANDMYTQIAVTIGENNNILVGRMMAIMNVVFLSTLDCRRDRSAWFPVSFLSRFVF
jgi:hypothetical protein